MRSILGSDQEIDCKNHRSTVGPSSCRGHSTTPLPALTTRAGGEWVSHALQAICGLDENATEMCRQCGCCWLLRCASVRANLKLRVIRPDLVVQLSRGHDASLWQCVSDEMAKSQKHCPSLGGMWSRSAEMSRVAAMNEAGSGQSRSATQPCGRVDRRIMFGSSGRAQELESNGFLQPSGPRWRVVTPRAKGNRSVKSSQG